MGDVMEKRLRRMAVTEAMVKTGAEALWSMADDGRKFDDADDEERGRALKWSRAVLEAVLEPST